MILTVITCEEMQKEIKNYLSCSQKIRGNTHPIYHVYMCMYICIYHVYNIYVYIGAL